MYDSLPIRTLRFCYNHSIRKIWDEIRLTLYRNGLLKADFQNLEFDLSESAITRDMRLNMLSGGYESREIQFIKNYLPSDFPVVDVGAGIGVSTCVAATCISKNIPVIAIEAHDGLIPALRKNIELNNLNIKTVDAAYHPTNKTVSFNKANNPKSSGYTINETKENKSISKRATNLSALMDKFEFDGFSCIIDIEGAEHDMIRSENKLLTNNANFIIIELHGDDNLRKATLNRLQSSGFNILDELDETVYVLEND